MYLLLLRAQQLVMPVAGFVMQGKADGERLVANAGSAVATVVRVPATMGLELFAGTAAAISLAGFQQLADGVLIGVMAL